MDQIAPNCRGNMTIAPLYGLCDIGTEMFSLTLLGIEQSTAAPSN